MAKRITVVVSQGQSSHPSKRDLEETIVAEMMMEPGMDVVVVPHLYDLTPDGTGVLALQGIAGPIVIVSWLYERATRWTLDRIGVRGQVGLTLIQPPDDDDSDEENEAEMAADDDKERVIDSRPTPNRKIYCLNLNLHAKAQPYIDELRRIRDEINTQVVELTGWIGGSPKPEQMERFLRPVKEEAANATATETPNVVRIEETPDRRWYPVIDYSRCTNCMECIDFCLFGVYGVDKVETILVEQPDNCRKGCPACSRVCPENAIIFPQHKTPAIAGAEVKDEGGMKIDLSRLFGAPETGEDAIAIAARERDEQLMMAGREAVGTSVGIPKRQTRSTSAEKDELDSLIDGLDELDV